MDKSEKLKEYGFDLAAYEKAKDYERDGLVIDVIASLASLTALVLFIFFGAKPLYGLLKGVVTNTWGVRTLYILSFSLGFFLLELPSDWAGFRLEHRYDLSNQAMDDWIKDQLKSLLLSGVLALAGFSLLFWAMSVTDLWWLWTWVGFTVISVFLGFISPTILMPLFYDFEPLEDQELKETLEGLAREAGIDVLGAFNMRASAKTKKAIGALTGIGSSRRIILSDTMLEQYTPEEIEAVIAHEMGHHKNNDLWVTLLVQSLLSLIGLFLIATFFDPVLSFFGLGRNVSTLPLVLGLMELLLFILSPLKNWISRVRERAADDFSLDLIDRPEALGQALVKLSQQNLGNPAPPKPVELLFYDHPSGLSRVKKAFEHQS